MATAYNNVEDLGVLDSPSGGRRPAGPKRASERGGEIQTSSDVARVTAATPGTRPSRSGMDRSGALTERDP